jgi:hypothetical protein
MLTEKADDIELNDTGFYLDSIHYAFDDVDSLRFYHVVTEKTVNFRSAGTDYNAELDIFLIGAERPVSVRNSPVKHFLDMNAAEREAAPVLELYREIARRTFRLRLARYSEALEKEGCFHYDNKQISKSGIVSDGTRAINLLVERPLLRFPFKIVHPAPPPTTLADRLRVFISGQRDFVISTQFDSDVLFVILDRYFKLHWDA